jgi:hypothetical protein
MTLTIASERGTDGRWMAKCAGTAGRMSVAGQRDGASTERRPSA